MARKSNPFSGASRETESRMSSFPVVYGPRRDCRSEGEDLQGLKRVVSTPLRRILSLCEGMEREVR